MATSHGPDRPSGQGRLPRNRFRLIAILTFVVILIVIFGYMLLVAGTQ